MTLNLWHERWIKGGLSGESINDVAISARG